MARGKKQSLSAEELVEQALVPEEEQPYEVPGNWVWVKFGHLAIDIADGPFGSNLKKEHYTDSKEVRIIQLSNIGENGWREDNTKYTTYEHAETISRSLVKPGEIVIAKMMPAGRAIIVPNGEKAYVLSSDAIKFVPKKSMNTKYMLYAINSNMFRNQITLETQGITRARTSIGKIKTYAFPLPPLTEQQRIVDRIESLFAKLDQVKELAQNALDSFETRKAAILHKAFTGELTAKWREEHGVGMDSWETIPLSKLAFIQTGLAKGKQFNSDMTTMPYLRVANVQDGYLDLSEIKLITVEKNKIERYLLKEGDVLFTEGGDYDKLGRGTVWRAEIDNCLHQNHVFAVRPESTVLNPFYLAYLASSRYGKAYFLSCSKQTTNLASINSTQLKAFPVLCPNISEQQEIVSVIDVLIEKEQSAKNKLEHLLNQIDVMKKSILFSAFRGELGTNDQSEESALELLKEVILSTLMEHK